MIVFEHEFATQSLRCLKTNNLNELNSDWAEENNTLGNTILHADAEEVNTSISKIISVQTLIGNIFKMQDLLLLLSTESEILFSWFDSQVSVLFGGFCLAL